MADWDIPISRNDEDIHTANERRLGEIIGKDISGKLHTGTLFFRSMVGIEQRHNLFR